MTPPSVSPTLAQARAEFDELVKDIRPELHRYATRMIGSAIEAEDVVQDALAKAYYALPTLPAVSNLRGWLFRITHNKAIDHLRRQGHLSLEQLDDDPPAAEADQPLEQQELVAIALAVFLKLAPRQRSCVILKDVLGYSLAEISELLEATVPQIKAALHRGRTRLRELAHEVELDPPLPVDEQTQTLLARYIDHFNARDFEAVRTMLADEVRLELVGRARLRGIAEVGHYFHNYERHEDWQLRPGWVEGRAAILVDDPQTGLAQPVYFLLIEWQQGLAIFIRDYRYAPYVLQEAAVVLAK